MSYTRKYHDRIAVHYSGTARGTGSCSCGKSVSCSCYYSGTEYEDIYTNIDVDTNPFDHSVANCNTSVNVLTGTVVATEAAQIASIDANAKKVGGTIIEGFFKTIRSEISQQIAELSSKLDSHLAHLHSMAKRCVEKQTQMQCDYQRITGRYLKIFDDLNNEHSNRIYELDKPAFVFKNQSDTQNNRISENDLVSTVAVFGAEGGDLQARISASIAKKRALDTIGKANTFLVKQKRLNDTINQSMLKESVAAVRYSLVCFIETQNEKSQIGKNLYQADFLPKMQTSELIPDFQGKNWNNISKENSSQIGRYFNAEVSSRYNDADTHTFRVRENIVKMLNFNQIKSI
jgi:hypothetical protein